MLVSNSECLWPWKISPYKSRSIRRRVTKVSSQPSTHPPKIAVNVIPQSDTSIAMNTFIVYTVFFAFMGMSLALKLEELEAAGFTVEGDDLSKLESFPGKVSTDPKDRIKFNENRPIKDFFPGRGKGPQSRMLANILPTTERAVCTGPGAGSGFVLTSANPRLSVCAASGGFCFTFLGPASTCICQYNCQTGSGCAVQCGAGGVLTVAPPCSISGLQFGLACPNTFLAVCSA